jgi:F-box protein 9
MEQPSSSSSSSSTDELDHLRFLRLPSDDNHERSGDWELTWPIWHMLPRTERKELAQRYGYKTIGDFEEFMFLQQARMDSAGAGQEAAADVTNQGNNNAPETPRDGKPSTRGGEDGTRGLSSVDVSDCDSSSVTSTSTDQPSSTLSSEELIQRGGLLLSLPDLLIHSIFEYLPVDTFATCALVSPHWKHFTRTERVYQLLCERVYLRTSKRKQLQVSEFNYSFRHMLYARPRVRSGNGVYVMQYKRIKPIQRDLWTEVRIEHFCNCPSCPMFLTVFFRCRWVRFSKWCITDTFISWKMGDVCMR